MPYCSECEDWFAGESLQDKLDEQREAVLYLLKELGFDCTILQGSGHADLPLDDVVVMQNLKQQLPRVLRNSVYGTQCAIVDIDNKGG